VFVDDNLGAISANFLFGCMLGMTGAVGTILGLPLDIRHVTFSAANLAYACAGLDYQVPADVLTRSIAGVALIGLVNLSVSFSLALYVALRSRGATLAAVPALMGHVLQRIAKNPLRLLLPPGLPR
jgi:site-specific recombinase